MNDRNYNMMAQLGTHVVVEYCCKKIIENDPPISDKLVDDFITNVAEILMDGNIVLDYNQSN